MFGSRKFSINRHTGVPKPRPNGTEPLVNGESPLLLLSAGYDPRWNTLRFDGYVAVQTGVRSQFHAKCFYDCGTANFSASLHLRWGCWQRGSTWILRALPRHARLAVQGSTASRFPSPAVLAAKVETRPEAAMGKV
jgi:hypothetical protein